MSFQPDANQRVQEGAQRYESQLEDLERAARHGKHAGDSGRSRRWLWVAVVIVVVLALLFVVYQVSVPADTPLPIQ